MKIYWCVSRCATKLSGKSAVTSLERSATRLVILILILILILIMIMIRGANFRQIRSFFEHCSKSL